MTAVPADFGVDARQPAASDTAPAPTDRISSGALAIFSGPAFPLAALALPLVVYLPHFYAVQMGMSLAAIGAIFSIVRLLDIGFDPILGAIMDRTNTRFGRFKPWMAASIPLLTIACWLVFMPPKGVSSLYLTISLTVMYVGYSMAVLGHLAWGSVLAGDYHQRSRIYGWVQAGTVGGMILVLVLPIIIAKLAPSNETAGVASMGWFVIVLTPITIGLALWRVKEPRVAARTAAPAGLGKYLKVLARPTVMRILACTILLATGPGITGALFLFFFRQGRGFSAYDTNIMLLVYFIGGFAGSPLWSKLAKAVGKHRAMMVSCLYYIAMQSLTLFTPPAAVWVGLPIVFLAGLGFSAYLILLRAMTADACDEARLDLHSDCTGMLYALQNAGTKIGSALGVAITFPLLQVFGFHASDKVQNTPAALHALELTYVFLPIAFAVVGALSLVGYRLNETRHGEIREALAARDAA